LARSAIVLFAIFGSLECVVIPDSWLAHWTRYSCHMALWALRPGY